MSDTRQDFDSELFVDKWAQCDVVCVVRIKGADEGGDLGREVGVLEGKEEVLLG